MLRRKDGRTLAQTAAKTFKPWTRVLDQALRRSDEVGPDDHVERRTTYIVMSLVVILEIGVIAVGATHLATLETQDLHVTVIETHDDRNSGLVTRMVVQVLNPGPKDVVPNFRVPSNIYQNWNAWDVDEGPEVLPAGQTAAYVISTPDFTGAFWERRVVVIVHHEGDLGIMGRSEPFQPLRNAPLESVVNPGFIDWLPSMIAEYDLPYGWVPFKPLRTGDEFTIEGSDGRLQLTLEPSLEGDPAQPAMIAVRQRIPFPSHLTIEMASDPIISDTAISGVIFDNPHLEQRVFVLHRAENTVPKSLTEHLAATAPNADVEFIFLGNNTTIDMVAAYRSFDWNLPARQAFLGTRVGGPETFGAGAFTVAAQLAKFTIERPIELELFVASLPPHAPGPYTSTFAYVGGPRLDQNVAFTPQEIAAGATAGIT